MNLTLNFGDFFLELTQDSRGFHWMNKNGNIKHFIQIDNRREPAFRKITRIGNNKKSPNQFFAQIDFPGIYLESRWGDDVLQFQNTGLVNFAGQNRRHGQLIFFENIKN